MLPGANPSGSKSFGELKINTKCPGDLTIGPMEPANACKWPKIKPIRCYFSLNMPANKQILSKINRFLAIRGQNTGNSSDFFFYLWKLFCIRKNASLRWNWTQSVYKCAQKERNVHNIRDFVENISVFSSFCIKSSWLFIFSSLEEPILRARGPQAIKPYMRDFLG